MIINLSDECTKLYILGEFCNSNEYPWHKA